MEIRKEEKNLSMGLFAYRDFTSTLRHYSQCPVNLVDVNRLCRELLRFLDKADAGGALSEEEFKGFKKAGQVLWEYLLARPVKDRLKSEKECDLILSIDEELVTVPWGLLYDGSDFLCLKYNVGRLVRTRGQEHTAAPVYRSSSHGAVLKMLILANPTNDLVSAYREGLHIKNQFDRKRECVRIDFKSTVIDRLYVKKNLTDYDLVHFAGHCEYDSRNPANTGWLLQDGRFTTQDILSLSSSTSLPSLIFSNACHSAHHSLESGIGSGEDECQHKNYNLASAFLLSGVRHYIGTIRKVEDSVSSVLARAFYSHILGGCSVGESLRQSRLQVINEYGLAHILWAGYILYGNPDAVLFKGDRKCAGSVGRPKDSTFHRRVVYAVSAACACALGAWMLFFSPTLRPDALVMFMRAQKSFSQGHNEEALDLSKRILAKDALFLAAYPLAADTSLRLGDKENAIKYYYDYCRYSERKHDARNLASAYSGLGWSYHMTGNYAKAYEFYSKAIDLSRKSHDAFNEAITLRRLAVWHIDKKEDDKALELLMKSSEINRERQNMYDYRYNLACDYFDIGLVFTNKDDYATAREFYTKSRLLLEKMKCSRELSDCYFNLGELFLYEKEYQKALDYYRQGLAIDLSQHNKFNLGGDYAMIAELYGEMEDYLQAEEYFTKAATASAEIKSLPDLASAQHQLGLLYKKTGRRNKAREAFRRAQEIYRELDQEKYGEIRAELSALDAQ